MSHIMNKTKIALLVAACCTSLAANATNGYFSHGYGTKNKGLAGGGVALPQDAMIAATNPAGMVMVGNRLDAGAAIFSPSPRSYSATAGTAAPDGTNCNVIPGNGCPFTLGGNGTAQSIESDNDYFLIPHFAYNRMLSPDASFGVTVYGNGGMNTEYVGGQAQHDDGSAFPAEGSLITTPGTFGAGTAGVNLEQLFINLAYANKISATAAWGASAILAYQRFEAKGLGTFQGFSTSASNLTDKGTDTSTGLGAKFGIQGEIVTGTTLAASYQTKIKMSPFDKYKGLFAENGDFDIPATWTVGLAWKPTASSAVTLDMQKIMYSDVGAVGNPFIGLISPSGCAGGTTTFCLGGANGAGFGWQDMKIYKLGYQWESSPDWTWRVGASMSIQPINTSEVVFNILAPAVMEEHLTFGFTHKVSSTAEFSFAAMYAPSSSVTGPNPLNPSQNITLEMTQYELEASWGWKF